MHSVYTEITNIFRSNPPNKSALGLAPLPIFCLKAPPENMCLLLYLEQDNSSQIDQSYKSICATRYK